MTVLAADDEAEESRSLDFSLLIVPCINVPAETETVYDDFKYVLGDPKLELPLVEALFINCTNSIFSFVPD